MTKSLQFFTPKASNSTGAIFIDTGISAGFPSPADDFKETRISLDEELITNKEATFFAKVNGQSMIGAGLDDNDFRGGFLNKYLKSFNNEDTFFINDSIEKSLKGEINLYNKTLEKSKVERIEKIRINLLNNYLKIL